MRPDLETSYFKPREIKIFRRFTYLFQFYASSTAHDYLLRFKGHLKKKKVRNCEKFILHNVRKLAIRSVKEEKNEDAAREFA
jgi:hypothetical protein